MSISGFGTFVPDGAVGAGCAVAGGGAAAVTTGGGSCAVVGVFVTAAGGVQRFAFALRGLTVTVVGIFVNVTTMVTSFSKRIFSTRGSKPEASA